jgi:dGTPase
MFNIINSLKKFNYQKIYLSDKLIESTYYFKLVLNSIYDLLKESFNNKEKSRKVCPELINDFEDWIKNYWNIERQSDNKNDIIFNIENEKDYYKAIIYYISGMTDNYAIEMYNKIIKF